VVRERWWDRLTGSGKLVGSELYDMVWLQRYLLVFKRFQKYGIVAIGLRKHDMQNRNSTADGSEMKAELGRGLSASIAIRDVIRNRTSIMTTEVG
jgi:hypothetical protein